MNTGRIGSATRRRAGLQAGEALPLLKLPDIDDRVVSSWDFYGQRNLVLLFLHGIDCPDCRKLLRGFAERYKAVREEEAEVLAIAQGSRDAVRRMALQLALPYPVLVDSDGEAHARYGAMRRDGEPASAVLVADRYGEIHGVSYESEGHQPLDGDEVLSWLRFIEIKCPECGAPEWPA